MKKIIGIKKCRKVRSNKMRAIRIEDRWIIFSKALAQLKKTPTILIYLNEHIPSTKTNHHSNPNLNLKLENSLCQSSYHNPRKNQNRSKISIKDTLNQQENY